MSERVEFTTSDGVRIVGDYYAPEGAGRGAILLLHMMPATRQSWKSFAENLASAGFSALAIDLRGHGESIYRDDGMGNKEQLEYKEFSDEEHQKSILDVGAAVEYLKKRDIGERLFLAGASIGANLALQYVAKDPDVSGAILLSAGLNYMGIETIPLAQKLGTGQSVYVVASKDDMRSGGPADEQAQKIYDSLSSKKIIKVFETGGHGTDILDSHPEFQDELVEWLKGL